MPEDAIQLLTLHQTLTDLQHQLQQQFSVISSGLSQCEVGKKCPDNLDIKDIEGRMQAVTDLLRCVNRHAEIQNVIACFDAVNQQWQNLSEIGPSWITYKQAGLEEIEKIRLKT